MERILLLHRGINGSSFIRYSIEVEYELSGHGVQKLTRLIL